MEVTTLVRRRADPALAGRLQGSVSPFAGDVVVGPDGVTPVGVLSVSDLVHIMATQSEAMV